jgi:hypothetical protein
MIPKSYQAGGSLLRRTVVKKTISLQPDVWEYVCDQAKRNLSGFINDALRAHRRSRLQRAMIEGYKAMASDRRLAEELSLSDTTLLDGLDEEEDGPTR